MNDAARMSDSARDISSRNRPKSPDPLPEYPYPGLRPFKREEVAIFYGRNTQKDAILERLNRNHMVFILGSSGCGKSSLVKAGVIPALRAGLLTKQGYDWKDIEMRPGRRPLVSLAEAFSEAGAKIARKKAEAKHARERPESEYTRDRAKAEFESDRNAELAGGPLKAERAGDSMPSGPAEFLSCFENVDEGLWSATSMLPDVLREGPRKNAARYLLLVDQFEEIFGNQIEKSSEVDDFVKLLTAQYLRPHPALFVVFTMRSDYLGNCSSFPGLAEAVNNCSYLTPILNASELREAIERPATDYNATIEPELVERILAEMCAGANYNSDSLPLMQHGLLWLWQRARDAGRGPGDADSRVRLTADDYLAFGGMKGILKKHADETLQIAEGEDGEYEPVAEALFRRLSERDEQGRFRRSPATFAEIKKITGCSDDDLERVVAPFADEKASFLEIRPADVSDERLLDISHEALIRAWDKAREWATQEREKFETFGDYLRSATAWRDGGRNSKSLKGQPDLDAFKRWWQGSTPSGGWFGRYFDPKRGNYSSADDAVAWVDRYRLASLKAYRFRKLRSRAVGVVAVSLAIFVPWYVAYNAHLNAERARAQAIADGAESALRYEGPAKALLIATQAQKLGLPDLAKTERVLFAALRQLREKRVISGLPEQVTGIAYSPDGSVIVSLDNRLLQFRDAKQGTPIDTVSLPAAGSFGVTWSAKSDWIGVNLDNSTLLLRPCSHEKIRRLFPTCRPEDKDQMTTLGDSQNVGGLPRFSSDGKWAVTGSRTQPPVLWNIATGEGKRLATKNAPLPFDVAISPDTKTIAVGSGNSEIFLVDPATGTTTQTLAAPTEKLGNVLALDFNPTDSNMLAASLQDGHILVWNIKGNASTVLSDAGGTAYNLSFSPDGKFVTAASDDFVLRTWSTEGLNEKPVQLRGHAGPVYVLAYSPDGKALVSGSADKTIRIWDDHSPLARSTTSGPAIDAGSRPPELPSWILSGLPPKFGDVVADVKEGDRVVVASKEGNLALFVAGADPRAIVSWRSPEQIAALSIEHGPAEEHVPNRIVAISENGDRTSWPHFRGIGDLVQLADDNLPFVDGDLRMTLSSKELCAISPPSGGCPSDEALGDFR